MLVNREDVKLIETISRLLEMFSEPQEAGRTEREMQEVEEGRK